jgi:hypothetical protein
MLRVVRERIERETPHDPDMKETIDRLMLMSLEG